MMVLASATSLVTVFLGLELLSIALYIVCGYARGDTQVAGGGGEVPAGRRLRERVRAVRHGADLRRDRDDPASPTSPRRSHASTSNNPLILLGIVLMGVGFAFKISAAPFHMWTPDVYQGAPIPVTAFMSVGTKAAGFAMIIRIFAGGLPHLAPEWQVLLAFVAAASMIVGNLMAIVQSSLKRLLAYSGIAQAGYVLIGVIAGGQNGLAAVLFYLFVYMFMNFGAFAVVTMLAGPGRRPRPALGPRRPLPAQPADGDPDDRVHAVARGLPAVRRASSASCSCSPRASAPGYTWLVVLAVLMSVVSVFYYVRVLIPVWSSSVRTDKVESSASSRMAIVLSGALSLVLGLYPTTVLIASQLGVPISFFGP